MYTSPALPENVRVNIVKYFKLNISLFIFISNEKYKHKSYFYFNNKFLQFLNFN